MPLYLAYVSGVCAFRLVPRMAIAVPGGQRLLERIIEVLLACRYSFHDLSRVELDIRRPPTPRMNMPLKLGLTVMASYYSLQGHMWCIFEKDYRRVLKSLGDLAGSDLYCHGGKPEGVLRQIASALVLESRQPEMWAVSPCSSR